MNLEEKSSENLAYMIDEIKTKLQVVNGAALKAENFDMDRYDDVKDLYEMVDSKQQFSVSELDAIVSELGGLMK
ncbi:DUF1128 domain-containing protein [Alteribacillus sp. HJP-4]|uniref:DUF1128 domain-containing protein n=1 Tax=Alteribacillus sp. HJP-4 TaxID=2775394 RepID=UPI0035CCDF87